MSEEFTRPNGKRYRPRKPGLVAEAWEDDHGGVAGIIILGTLDPDTARPIAQTAARAFFGTNAVTADSPGWFRNGFQMGQRGWFIDTEKGRPGVSFEAVDA